MTMLVFVIITIIVVFISTIIVVAIITLLIVAIVTIFLVVLLLTSGSYGILLWCFFHHSPGVRTLYTACMISLVGVSFEITFDASNNFVGSYDGIIANCSFPPRNIIKFEILKGAMISCILKKSLDIWEFENLTMITNCFLTF